jgi:hypothetical protein
MVKKVEFESAFNIKKALFSVLFPKLVFCPLSPLLKPLAVGLWSMPSSHPPVIGPLQLLSLNFVQKFKTCLNLLQYAQYLARPRFFSELSTRIHGELQSIQFSRRNFCRVP